MLYYIAAVCASLYKHDGIYLNLCALHTMCVHACLQNYLYGYMKVLHMHVCLCIDIADALYSAAIIQWHYTV